MISCQPSHATHRPYPRFVFPCVMMMMMMIDGANVVVVVVVPELTTGGLH